MRVPIGTYVRDRHYGLGRVIGYDSGLFPRIRLRFEDGEDRALDLDPNAAPGNPTLAPAAPPRLYVDPPPRAGSAFAPLAGSKRGASAVRLADGRVLEIVASHGVAAPRTVFTIGYEGRTVDRLIADLREHHVGMLVDIRDAPVSKKSGFSKPELAAACEEAGIEYVLKREWGNPKRKGDVGDARKDRRLGLRRYTTHLAPHIVDAAAFVQAILDRRPAFLCYEAEPFHCHRSRFISLVLPHCEPAIGVCHILARADVAPA